MEVTRAPKKGLLHAIVLLIMALSVAWMPRMAYAEGATKISVASVSAGPGDTVEVPVTIENSPGILGATLEVSYDEGLTLTGASSGDAFSALTMTKPGALTSPCRFTWDGVEISADDVKDGQILVLTFTVADSVEEEAQLAVSVAADAGAVLDGDLNAVDVTFAAGGVTISSYVPGDLDRNKIVNSRDVIFARRHIVGGYTQDVHTCAADVNDDKVINSLDVILMRRFIAGGYGVELAQSRLHPDNCSGTPIPDPDQPCSHKLTAVAAKSPTCTEGGNIAYWQCSKCKKCFTDAKGTTEVALEETKIEAAGHTPVIDPPVPPTSTEPGLTEGSHCLVCGEVLKEPKPIPIPDEEFYISYDIANGDPYLATLDISNPNKTSYSAGDSFKLNNLSAGGYRFIGWYDGAGDDATKVTRVTADMAEDLELYAHWQVIEYKVQYESDLFLETSSAKYTSAEGLVLPTPKLSNYVFAGWTDEEGKLYGKRIPVGTTGNITLKANWTSERNKTYTNPNPSDPVIYEDEENKTIVFAYEIGRIENVPLYTIKDFGYIGEDGVTRSAEEEYSAHTDETTAVSISNAVAKATTNSSNWTLSSGWNETTTYDEEWLKEQQKSITELDEIYKSNTNTWNVSNSSYGSKSTTKSKNTIDGWNNEIKLDARSENSTTEGWKNSAELSGKLSGGKEIGADIGIADGVGLNAKRTFGWEIAGKVAGEQSKTTTNTSSGGIEIGGSRNHTVEKNKTTNKTSGWNNSSSYGGSSTTGSTKSHSETLSELLSEKTHYGKSYNYSGSETRGQETSDTNTHTYSYNSVTTYNSGFAKKVKNSWTTAATKAGYHRWVIAGTAHVFGVVGYDIKTDSFFVYTHTIMDDETHQFEDYSNVSASYNDSENGVITFEVPYDEVMNTVSDRVNASDGLKVDLETGTVVAYTGTDAFVTIPEYYNAGNGDVVKITGISSGAFAGNTNIAAVDLSDFITEIPDNAFAGCTSLRYVDGVGVTSIGASAFSGCSSMEDCGVYSQVTYLGDKAFEGADHVYVNAANAQVAKAAIASGAKEVVLNLRFLKDDEDVLNKTTLDVPSTVERFELNGDGRTFNGLTINSDAGETVLNKINIAGTSALPVKISSPKVTLNQSSISSPGIALALTAQSTDVGLRGTTTVSSTSSNAMFSRNIKLYETASDVVGKLVVKPSLLVCGSIDGMSYLQCDNVKTIDDATFNRMLTSFTVSFDAAEGTCSETTRDIAYGVAIGELPVPIRDYYTFEGWYLESTGEEVTAETVLPAGENLVLVAHWKENDLSDWVKASEVPEGAQKVNTKWTYDLSVYKQVVESYTYFRYCSQYDGIWNQDSCWINGTSAYHEITVGSPIGGNPNKFEDKGGRAGDICGPYSSCAHKREGQSYWWLKSVNHKTVLDRVENKESSSQPSGENISNIVEWAQYRAK